MGIAWIRRAWSRQDGNLYSKKRKNALIAASRTLRVRAELPRVPSRCSRNAKISGASSCSGKGRAGSCSASHQQRFSGLSDLDHETWCGLQVPIGVGHVRVAEVGAERHDVAGDDVPFVTTLLQRADCEGVTQVVHAWISA